MTHLAISLSYQIWMPAIMKLGLLLLVFMTRIMLTFSLSSAVFSHFYATPRTSYFPSHHSPYSISSPCLRWSSIPSCGEDCQALLNSHSPRKIPQSPRRYCKTNHKVSAILEGHGVSPQTRKCSGSRCIQRLLSKIPWIRCSANFGSFCKRICEPGGRCSSLVSRFSPPDPAAYARNCQVQLDMMFVTNDKYSTIDMLSDLSDLKNLGRMIGEKVVEYLSGEQDPLTGGLAARMFILRDFRDEVVDTPINLSWNYLILHQLIFERVAVQYPEICVGSNDPTKCQQRLVTTFHSRLGGRCRWCSTT